MGELVYMFVIIYNILVIKWRKKRMKNKQNSKRPSLFNSDGEITGRPLADCDRKPSDGAITSEAYLKELRNVRINHPDDKKIVVQNLLDVML
jgi:hypothetical protein